MNSEKEKSSSMDFPTLTINSSIIFLSIPFFFTRVTININQRIFFFVLVWARPIPIDLAAVIKNVLLSILRFFFFCEENVLGFMVSSESSLVLTWNCRRSIQEGLKGFDCTMWTLNSPLRKWSMRVKICDEGVMNLCNISITCSFYSYEMLD